ncbi:heme oxygenase (decycling) 1 [Dissophora globulifera]|nr:heme oxygenase (decycling) 1 [Dissophora globulifera]
MTLLSNDLKQGTKILHAEAGRSKFMKYFFKGEVTMETYGRFLISLYQVYNALERALNEHKDNPAIALIYFPEELFRLPALVEDIEFFNGPNWRDMLTPVTPGQQAYISAIERCASSQTPELLVAHAYTRYLGDLSGGQVLAKRLQKYNDLPDDKGAAFYEFGLIEDNNQFKELFRKRLNQIEVSEELHQQIVEEAKETFLRNIDLFEEFDSELEGLPMTAKEQEQMLVDLEIEKSRLQAQDIARKQAQQPSTSAANNGSVWSSLMPTALFTSLFSSSNQEGVEA